MAHERVLTQDEKIDLIAAWVQGGAPEGPPEAAVEPPFSTTDLPVLANADISVIMEAYTIPTEPYGCVPMLRTEHR